MGANIWKQYPKTLYYSIRHPLKTIGDFVRSVKWAWQRSVRGYADTDWWNMCDWMTEVLSDMLDTCAEKHFGFPAGDDGFTDEELLSMLFPCEPEFTPGTKFSYSNTGYTLLAMIIEKITGESYAEYVRKNIFDVCGMEHSSSMETGDVTSVPEFVPDDSSPFDDPYELVDTLYMQLIKPQRGVGDIHSCAADMLLFDRALIGGKLINEDSLAEMFHIDKGYGCGWVQADRWPDIYYHGGETYIYKAYNLYAKTKRYGNLYLIQLHPTVAGDQYSNDCMMEIIRAVMK